jgi:hypothetical protein
MEGGLLQQIPVKALNLIFAIRLIRLHFHRPTPSLPNPSDPWNQSCEVSDILVFVTAY